MMRADYVIVGAGLTGSTIARVLHDAGREVVVLERRAHTGGNVHSHVHPSGVEIHTYGPHCFRTSSDRIWAFVHRFATFRRFEAVVRTRVDGALEPWPVTARYMRRLLGDDWRPERSGEATNLEEAALALMPRPVYERFVKEYNEKQWGVEPTRLSPALCTRFAVRHDDDPRLMPHVKHQGLPEIGYAGLMERMVEGIALSLGFDYLARRHEVAARRALVYTGPIDAFFGFDEGRLSYRGQHRAHTYRDDVGLAQPCMQVNNPQHEGGAHVRTIEWKHLMRPDDAAKVRGTVLTTETPYSPTDPDRYEYPLPDRPNADLYARYRRRADAVGGVVICGRLGEYRYLDMDQAIGRALVIARRLLAKDGRS